MKLSNHFKKKHPFLWAERDCFSGLSLGLLDSSDVAQAVFVHSFSTLHAVHSGKSIQFFVAAINSMFVHCETLTTSGSTLHNLTGPLSDRCVPNTLKQLTPVKRKQRDTGDLTCPRICLSLPISPLRSHWSIWTLCSYAQQTPRQQRRLLFPSDSMTTHVSIKEGKEPYCCHPRRGKSNETRWQARLKIHSTLYISYLPPRFGRCSDQY